MEKTSLATQRRGQDTLKLALSISRTLTVKIDAPKEENRVESIT